MSIIGIPQQLKSLLTVRHSDSTALKGEFYVLTTKTGSEDLQAELLLRQLTSDLKGIFSAQSTANLKGLFIVRHVSSAALKGIATIRHPDTEILSAEFRVSIEGWEMQGLDASVYRDLGVIS